MTVTSSITLPLPADVDLSGMEHMPLFDERLRKSRSWLRAKNWRGDGPGLGFCLFNLWARAFREVPAGSIEDDDDVLAEAAACDISHWLAIKERALTGWQLIDGRHHHPVVSQIAWDLWRARLEKRYELKHMSWKAACTRALDAGREPPQSPGSFTEWLATVYPATALYIPQGGVVVPTNDPGGTSCHDDKGEKSSDIHPKRREGKVIPPCSPPGSGEPGGSDGLGTGDAAKAGKAGKVWFAGELGRLQRELGREARMFADIAAGENAKKPVKFSFVERFKACWADRSGGHPVLLFPSKRRADAFTAERGALMAVYLPDWRWRHASVAELRDFKTRNSA